MNAIPLSVLIEASECLKLARLNALPGTYVRILDAQCKLQVEIDLALRDKTMEVTQ